jgi:hypothetical protein
LSWATQILFRKNLAPPRKPSLITFRFFASLRGSFFALSASVSLSGVSEETNFLANILAGIRKSRWFFANLARKSVVQAKLLANRPSQSARRNEEPRENRGQLRCCIWYKFSGASLCASEAKADQLDLFISKVSSPRPGSPLPSQSKLRRVRCSRQKPISKFLHAAEEC